MREAWGQGDVLLSRRDGQEALRGCAGSGEAARPGPWGTLSSRESPLLVPYQRVCVHLWVASAGRVASRAWGSQPFPCPLLPCGSDSQPDCCKTVRVSGARLGLRGVELSLVLFIMLMGLLPSDPSVHLSYRVLGRDSSESPSPVPGG